MTNTTTLNAAPREVIGKQVKALRRQGLIPAVVYGPTRETPLSVLVEWPDLRVALKNAGGTGLIDLQVEGLSSINVLVRSVQRHPVRRDVLHVDFYAVDVTQEIDTTIQIVILDAEVIGRRLGAKILQAMNTIEVRSLPTNIPAHIEVDPAALTRAGDIITVGQLPQIEGVVYLADEDLPVLTSVSIAELAEEAEAIMADSGDVSVEVEIIAKGKEEEEEF